MKINKLPAVRPSSTGFTLMELMIAAVILVLVLVGLIGLFTGCFTLNAAARNLTIAVNDAQCVMEEMRDFNIRSNITQEDWAAWAATDAPGGGGCNRLSGESIDVTFPAGIGVDPLQIVLTVNWTERGRAKSTELVTLLTER